MAPHASTCTSRFIRAEPRQLYDAFLDPATLLSWLPPGRMTGKIHEFDARVGGGYRMSLYYPADERHVRGKTAAHEDRIHVRFLELLPARRILQAVRFVTDDPDFSGQMTLMVTFEKVSDGTNVTLLFENLPPGIRPEDNETGSRQSLEQLAHLFENTIENARALFDLPEDVAYFNCASLAPLMRHAQEAGRTALHARGRPWQIGALDWFEGSERRRALLAQFVGISPENVALVPATSYGLAVAARNLKAAPGKRVLVLADEFPSNLNTWERYCRRHDCQLLTVRRSPDQSWTDAVLEALDERVAIASIPNVHWTDGSFVDLETIARRLRETGAKLVVDASQSLGALPFDFASVRPDYLVAVGYKWLLGPVGAGYLYVADEHLDGEPLEENWISRAGTEDFSALVSLKSEYRSGARRFDVGERTLFETTPIANAALETLIRWGLPTIARTLAAKARQVADMASALDLQHSLDSGPPRHMLGLRLPPRALANAPAVLEQHAVHVSLRGTSLRISPHAYTTERDIRTLESALKHLLSSG